MSDLNNNSCDCGCCPDCNAAVTLYNAPGLSALRYRLGTHGSFKKRMLDEIVTYPALSKLTTRDNDDLIIATIDAWATVLDVLTFYQERICNEGYLLTAIERLSVVYLARHINYIPAPGVAAGTCLVFWMNEAQGAPPSAKIPTGTKVQSIPKQNQLPQIFETIEPIQAKIKWNKIKPRFTSLYTPKNGDSTIYLDGTQTGLQAGDKILVVSSDHDYNSNDKDWDFRSVVNINTDTDAGYTIVSLDDAIGKASNLPVIPINITDTQILIKGSNYPNFNVVQHVDHYYNQPAVRQLTRSSVLLADDTFFSTYLPPVIQAPPPPVVGAPDLQGKKLRIYAMRQKANLFGNNAPDYKSVAPSVKTSFFAKGLLGTYYTGTNFDSFLQSQIDDQIDFNISDDHSTTTFPFQLTNNFSVRWTGFVLAPAEGDINFHTQSDDGVRLWVNDQLLINNWDDQPDTAKDGLISLHAGQLYSIKLEYYQGNNEGPGVINPGRITLSWWWAGSGNTIISNDNLFSDGHIQEWPDFSVSAVAGPLNQTIYLDNLYPSVVPNSLLVMATPDPDGTDLFRVVNTTASSRSGFTLTSKATRLGLSTNPDFSKFNSRMRDTFIYAQSEELPLAELPIIDPLNKEITLDSLLPDLFAGQKIVISGRRWRLQLPTLAGEVTFTPLDGGQPARYLKETSLVIVHKPTIGSNGKIQYLAIDDGGLQGTIVDDIDTGNGDGWTPKNLAVVPSEKDDDTISELHTIESINFIGATDSTQYGTGLALQESINTYFDLTTVLINANVAEATHGETKKETLGNGDGSLTFQKFTLKQKPLTFISADNPSGSQTTLEIAVNNIKWTEVPSFYGASPKDKIFTTTIADDGTVTVCFGDGVTGSRLPSGAGNVQAIYRTGIGLTGLMDAGQLSMLATPQLGVNTVNNPIASSGAQDPETIDTAQKNAPLTVLTLDRIVSVKDFENFARAFAGIAKARTDIIWNGEQEIINVTVAPSDGNPLDPSGQLYSHLLSALQGSGHTSNAIRLAGYTLSPFSIQVALSVAQDHDVDIVKRNVFTSLYNNFSFEAMSFGQDITAAQVIDVIQNVDGVIYVQLEKLGGQDPFDVDNDRLSATIPKLNSDGSIQVAQLLVIDVNNSTITSILT